MTEGLSASVKRSRNRKIIPDITQRCRILIIFTNLITQANSGPVLSDRSTITSPMTSAERRAVTGLAGIYGVRMLGLFLILPVFALYAEDLPGATPLLIGLAVGVYGLTQAILQIPFGMLSDRIGRKPVILGGLVLFAAGSVIAALADDIWLILIGRAIQGSGAIAAAVMALAADVTRESQRTKAMATIGMTIGAAFALSLMGGPLIDAVVGVSGIFWLTAILAVLAIVIVIFVIPSPDAKPRHLDALPLPGMFKRVLRDGQLLRLDYGIFSLHLMLTAMFLSLPLLLRDLGLPLHQHAFLYLAVLLSAILLMVPFIIMAEKYGRMKVVFVGAVATVSAAALAMNILSLDWLGVAVVLVVFFIGFNLLEATLPSLIAKTAPVEAKGTAMGVYSTSQFMGGFLGGMLGGWVHQQYGYSWVFVAVAIVGAIWLIVALSMQSPGQFRNRIVSLSPLSAASIATMQQQLLATQGVVEAVVMADEKVAYLKLDRNNLDESALEALLATVDSH